VFCLWCIQNHCKHFATDTHPTGDDLQTTVTSFEGHVHVVWDISQWVRAIDGSHIPVLAPADNHTDYYNQKGWYSVLVRGCWPQILFLLMWVSAGQAAYMMPGSCIMYTTWPDDIHICKTVFHISKQTLPCMQREHFFLILPILLVVTRYLYTWLETRRIL